MSHDLHHDHGVTGHLFWHVTDPKNAKSIQRHGLMANPAGMIFLLSHPLVADEVAVNQVFTNPYALFLVDGDGITGKTGPDEVGELSKGYHLIAYQAKIRPAHVAYLGDFTADRTRLGAWDYVVGKLLFGKTFARTRRWHAGFRRDAALLKRERRLENRGQRPEAS